MHPRSPSPSVPLAIILLAITGLGCGLTDQVYSLYVPSQPAAETPIPTRVVPSNSASRANPAGWTILLADDFEIDRGLWVTGIDDSDYALTDRQIVDGQYRWENTAKQSVHSYVFPDMEDVINFSVTLETRLIQWVEDGMDANLGVDFRIQENGDKYHFGISGEYFVFSKTINGEWITLLDWTESPAIQPRRANHIRVVGFRDDFAFYINNQLVAAVQDSQLMSGKIGVAFELYNPEDAAVLAFDNFEVRVP